MSTIRWVNRVLRRLLELADQAFGLRARSQIGAFLGPELVPRQ